MKQRDRILNDTSEKFLIGLFFLFALTAATTGFAKDLKIGTDTAAHVDTNILYAAAGFDSNRFSISYDGISSVRETVSYPQKMNHRLEPEMFFVVGFDPHAKNNTSNKVTQKLKATAEYLLKYIKFGSFTADTDELKPLIKSRVNTDQVTAENFDFNFSIAVGHTENKMIHMEALNFISCWKETHFNASYHIEKNEIEFGLSNAYVNECLLDGMKLEIQANPYAKSGVILLTKNL